RCVRERTGRGSSTAAYGQRCLHSTPGLCRKGQLRIPVRGRLRSTSRLCRRQSDERRQSRSPQACLRASSASNWGRPAQAAAAGPRSSICECPSSEKMQKSKAIHPFCERMCDVATTPSARAVHGSYSPSFLRAEVLHPGELSPSVLHRVYRYASWWNNDASHSMPYSTGKPCLLHSLKPPAMLTTLVRSEERRVGKECRWWCT